VFDYNQAVQYLVLAAIVSLLITIFFCLFFAVIGPKLTDKIVATNVIGFKAILIIIMVAVYLNQEALVDVALVFALLSFLATVVLTKFIIQFKLNKLHRKKLLEEQNTEKIN